MPFYGCKNYYNTKNSIRKTELYALTRLDLYGKLADSAPPPLPNLFEWLGPRALKENAAIPWLRKHLSENISSARSAGFCHH